MTQPPDTGSIDPHYDLIVTLQRALEDSWRFAHFADDARDADDGELADFFDELSGSDHDIAERCKSLLRDRLATDAALQ